MGRGFIFRVQLGSGGRWRQAIPQPVRYGHGRCRIGPRVAIIFMGDFHTLGTIEWVFNRGNGINGVMLGYSGAELG